MGAARRSLVSIPAIAVVMACIGILVVQDACILAQPSGEIPRIPETRPTILHASVVPSTTSVLTRFPSTFIVPVELADPTVRIVYAAFIDYNPLNNGDGIVDSPSHSDFEPSNTNGRIRTLNVLIPEPADTDRCHKIEVVVALRLVSETDQRNAHTPAEPGGDIATWFYNPSGDLSGCPALDAGLDASIDAEAGEGGVQ
ncbi:MAG: hypothetical protein JWP87_2570 [Labilithrix sp.]|nr:hypothetical protein [Labilithrix sp.]